MPYRIFAISTAEPEQGLKELNQFLISQRVIEVDKRFHADGPSVSWHFCINYAVKQLAVPDGDRVGSRYGSIDYKQELSPEDFAVYAKLREVRKEIADEKSIQLFTILTNKQLAELATRRVQSTGQLRQIEGIGEKKTAAFGQRFLDAIRAVSTADTFEETNSEEESRVATQKDRLFKDD